MASDPRTALTDEVINEAAAIFAAMKFFLQKGFVFATAQRLYEEANVEYDPRQGTPHLEYLVETGHIEEYAIIGGNWPANNIYRLKKDTFSRPRARKPRQ